VTVMIGLPLIVHLRMRDARHHSLIHED